MTLALVSKGVSPCAMTLALVFKGVSREWDDRLTWNEMMWVDRMLDPLGDLGIWPWPWIFKVKFWKRGITGMWGPIDPVRQGCESIGSRTHFVILNFDLAHDLDLAFSMSNCQKVISQDYEGRLTWIWTSISFRVNWPSLSCDMLYSNLTLKIQG